MHDAEGVFYFSAHADKKAVLDFCIMHGKENRKMCFPGIAREEHSVDHYDQVEHYQGHKPNHKQNHKQNHEQNHEQNQDSWTMCQTMNHKPGLDPIDPQV